MGYNSSQEVLDALINAYFYDRDISKVLSCVTDDVEWIGTEEKDCVTGKKDLARLLQGDLDTYPDVFNNIIEKTKEQNYNNVTIYTIEAKQNYVSYTENILKTRSTFTCIDTREGWLICNVHSSVSNSEYEKQYLEKAISQDRKKEEFLLNSIPGGVAIYRLKKDGIVRTEYVSEGLAKMCAYDKKEDFLEVLKNDALVNIVQEDKHLITEAIECNLKENSPISIMYRIYDKEGNELLQRLDANLMDDLEEDDLALWYAVHTIVSDETKANLNNLKQLSDLVDLVPCGLGIYEVSGGKLRLTYLNDAFYQGIGVTREQRNQFFGDLVVNAIHPDDTIIIQEYIEKLYQGSTQEHVIIRIRGGHEDWIWFSLTGSVVERDGDYLKIYVAYSNCNEMVIEQKAKEERYEELLRLRKLGTNDAISVGTFNLTHNMIMESDSTDKNIERDIYQCSVDAILKRIHHEADSNNNFPKTCDEMLQRYLKGEKHFYIRYSMTHNSHWVESVFDVITNPYNGDVEATGIMRDISETMRAELVVDKLLQIDYDSISTIDIESGIALPFTISASEKGMTKVLDIQEHTSDMASGLVDFFHTYCKEDDVERVIHDNSMEVILEHLQTQLTYETIYTINFGAEDEHKRIIYAYLDENKAQLICAVQNFTAAYKKEEKQKRELSKALQEANSANEAKTAFLSRVSHDMRTPLNGILGLTALVKDSISDEKVLADLDELEMSGQYLLDLINDTLDVSRIEKGKLELHPIVCDGKTLFNNAVNLGMPGIKEKDIKLNIQLGDIPFTLLYIDVGRLNQVMLNVLGNAVKFTDVGGKIDIIMDNISVENGVITDRIIIRDNGIGIDPKFLPHIFEPFSQEDQSTTNTRKGTGLGMSITKQLLDRMGGSISVESELGKGTTFTMIIKLNIATEEQIEEWKNSQVNGSSKVNLEGKRILLCEDHPLNAKIAIRVLEAKGMEVKHCKDGRIAVETFKQSDDNYYDAILMDIRMPIMDGIEATKKIRSLDRDDAKNIPIIAMTANAFKDDVDATKEAGMNEHLSKPIENDVLYNTLARLIK